MRKLKKGHVDTWDDFDCVVDDFSEYDFLVKQQEMVRFNMSQFLHENLPSCRETCDIQGNEKNIPEVFAYLFARFALVRSWIQNEAREDSVTHVNLIDSLTRRLVVLSDKETQATKIDIKNPVIDHLLSAAQTGDTFLQSLMRNISVQWQNSLGVGTAEWESDIRKMIRENREKGNYAHQTDRKNANGVIVEFDLGLVPEALADPLSAVAKLVHDADIVAFRSTIQESSTSNSYLFHFDFLRRIADEGFRTWLIVAGSTVNKFPNNLSTIYGCSSAPTLVLQRLQDFVKSGNIKTSLAQWLGISYEDSTREDIKLILDYWRTLTDIIAKKRLEVYLQSDCNIVDKKLVEGSKIVVIGNGDNDCLVSVGKKCIQLEHVYLDPHGNMLMQIGSDILKDYKLGKPHQTSLVYNDADDRTQSLFPEDAFLFSGIAHGDGDAMEQDLPAIPSGMTVDTSRSS